MEKMLRGKALIRPFVNPEGVRMFTLTGVFYEKDSGMPDEEGMIVLNVSLNGEALFYSDGPDVSPEDFLEGIGQKASKYNESSRIRFYNEHKYTR